MKNENNQLKLYSAAHLLEATPVTDANGTIIEAPDNETCVITDCNNELGSLLRCRQTIRIASSEVRANQYAIYTTGVGFKAKECIFDNESAFLSCMQNELIMEFTSIVIEPQGFVGPVTLEYLFDGLLCNFFNGDRSIVDGVVTSCLFRTTIARVKTDVNPEIAHEIADDSLSKLGGLIKGCFGRNGKVNNHTSTVHFIELNITYLAMLCLAARITSSDEYIDDVHKHLIYFEDDFIADYLDMLKEYKAPLMYDSYITVMDELHEVFGVQTE